MIIDGLEINAELIDVIREINEQTGYFSVIKDSVDNVMCQCCYHNNGQERNASAGFKKDTGVFHCFTCGEVHSLIEVISYCFGKKDLGAFGYQWLVKNFASVSIVDRKDIIVDCARDKETKEIEYVSEEELDKLRYYHPYMYKRGLTDEVIEIFDVGFDSVTQCITFPVRDISGGTLFLARRSVNTKFFHYPKGVSKPVYGVYELSKLAEYPNEVIICESILDALSCWVHGKYAVALNGLGSEEQYAQLNAMPCRKFILATDNDAAGLHAREVLRSKIKSKIVTEYAIPNGKKDMNELSDEEFQQLQEIF